ncbi:hypothetical protein QL093DRAFT_1443736 [Fusarium oxysporum]|nr:hypothetical protein QL093DRAFT_1443736 [Fusarium oxysporum]
MKRIAFPVFDQLSSSISPHISPDGNALRFSYRPNEMRKPKTRNASRFRRLTLVESNNLTTAELNNIHYHRLLKLTCLSSPYSIYSISAIPSYLLYFYMLSHNGQLLYS